MKTREVIEELKVNPNKKFINREKNIVFTADEEFFCVKYISDEYIENMILPDNWEEMED